MKNIIYIMKFFRNFPYADNFDLKNFLINMIIKDFNHWSYCFIIKIAKTIYKVTFQKKEMKSMKF